MQACVLLVAHARINQTANIPYTISEIATVFAADGDLKSHATSHPTTGGWKALSSSTSLTQGGNYYLTADRTSTLTIPSGVTVNLCLNGHNINKTYSGNAITVESGATLNLYDCQGGGTISLTPSGTSGSYSGIYASGTGTTVNLYGGTVSVLNSSGVKLEDGAHLLVDGAEVKSKFTDGYPNSPWGAVNIKSGASAEIKSGSVSIENTTNRGTNMATIYVDGSLIVSGGTVEGTDDYYGAII